MKGHQLTQERGEEAPMGREGQERGGPEPCLVMRSRAVLG